MAAPAVATGLGFSAASAQSLAVATPRVQAGGRCNHWDARSHSSTDHGRRPHRDGIDVGRLLKPLGSGRGGLLAPEPWPPLPQSQL